MSVQMKLNGSLVESILRTRSGLPPCAARGFYQRGLLLLKDDVQEKTPPSVVWQGYWPSFRVSYGRSVYHKVRVG